MIAGLIFLFAGLVLIALGVILPRIALRIHEAIGVVPASLQEMASSLVPGLGVGLALRARLPFFARIALGLGGLLLAFGVFAFMLRPTPLWLNLLAYGMLLALVVAVIALALLVKRFAPMLKELRQFTQIGGK
jgi:hypothetical protein